MKEKDKYNQVAEDSAGLTQDERKELVPDLLARRFTSESRSYWQIVWQDFSGNKPALIALWVMLVMALVAVFAPVIANHRPFAMFLPESIASDYSDGGLKAGWQFPLLAALGVSDWILLFGLLQALVAFFAFRRTKKNKNSKHSTAAIVLLLAGFLPMAITAWKILTGDNGSSGIVAVLKSKPWQWQVLFTLCLLVGLWLLLLNFARLCSAKTDKLGDVNTGGRIFGAFVGSALLLVSASLVGTLGQRKLDVLDYYKIAERDDVKAVFAPVQHDYLASDSYLKSQAPLGPYVRVQPSGGSLAASDLGLSDTRVEANLALENGTRASGKDDSALPVASALIPITNETLLSSLRYGAGVRKHDEPIKDFTIISTNWDRYSVLLSNAETVGDVIKQINKATRGDFVASINEQGTRIVLVDKNQSRPTNLMGTDASGSDVASRLIRATRVALSIGFVSTSIALMIGITVGSLMGYFGGWVDIAGMRVIEIFMAIPRLFLLLTIIAFIPPELNEYMLYAMMVVIGATSWMTSARYIRAEFFRLRDQDFIQSARACGLPIHSILFKHMLPNGVTPVLVDASFGVAAAIFIETGLSFLGFGIKPPDPSWGQMLAEAVDPSTGVFRWWMAIFPGVMIFLTVFAFNLIGDALRDAIDPKLKKAAQ